MYTGLLAGLWEFPAVAVESKEPIEMMWDKLQKELLGKAGLEHRHIGLVSLEFVDQWIMTDVVCPFFCGAAGGSSIFSHPFLLSLLACEGLFCKGEVPSG